MQEPPVDALVRRFPVGAEPLDRGVSFRVWAPDHDRVDVVVEEGHGAGLHPLGADGDGYFSGVVREAAVGTRYRFRLDGRGEALPDPASRFQPAGPHGPSQVVDPSTYRWQDQAWTGPAERQVVYEMHIGAFTPEGTWAAAAAHLPDLVDLGVTTLEIMPVADFAGDFGWGYDGVDLFAPTRLYGSPDDFRAFVDRAHAVGLAVILDVVYNHLGPDGAYLGAFARSYFSDRYDNEWGEALNFDGEDSGPVREFFIANAAYWIREYHLDGLRLDATQQIFDASPRHIVADIASAVREAAAPRRSYVVGENEPQDVRLVLPRSEGGYGLDALWNDDFHHTARVAATGRREAYMSDYTGAARELLAALRFGFLFQGQRYGWQGKRRGTSTRGLSPTSFVNYLQNHDQVANTPGARRLCALTSPGRARALAALLLLGPETPLLFMGEEFAAGSPFYYFADHEPDLARQVRTGRREFVKQFPGNDAPGADRLNPPPDQRGTFEASRLDWSERNRQPHAGFLALHRHLLGLRRDESALRNPFDGAVLGPECLLVRWFDEEGDDRILLVNLGADLVFPSLAEPLSAPPPGARWTVRWASEHPAYGGLGQPEVVTDEGWRIPGHAAVLLGPAPEQRHLSA